MKVEEQKQKLKVINYDSFIGDVKIPNKHGQLLPNDIRALICGKSGCGKSNLMLSLLFDVNGIRFKNVCIYSKSLFQPKYCFLKDVLEGVKGVGYYQFTENDEIMSPDEAKTNTVFIFDDVATQKQNKIRDFFSMGRHKSVDCFYLCQTYSCIPKQLIRDNANFIVLFQQDDLNLRHVYKDHVSGMSFDTFKSLCEECWKCRYGFLVIDKDNEKGRLRMGFDRFIINNR